MFLDLRLSLIQGTVLDMYVSVYHALDFADDLMSKKDSASKHRLEVELKTVKGFLEIALERLETEDLKESEV
jgi:VIT1/CCC1 family predicted Fe2+/Mn2+ transporter